MRRDLLTAAGRGFRRALAFCLPVLLLSANLWLANSVFVPIAALGQPTQYLLFSSSLALALWCTAAAALLLAMVAALAPAMHLRAFWWLALSLLPLLNLLPGAAGRAPALSYVLFDLRYAWWALVFAFALHDAAPARALMAWGARARAPWPKLALLALIPVLAAAAFTPSLRFSGLPHGDEPKYLRFCENFYQGQGFDIAGKRTLEELGADDRPQAMRNVRHLFVGLGQEALALATDASRAFRRDTSPRPRAGEPSRDMFFAGKRPGSIYQLHNPGLAFLVFPAYYLDRRFTGGGIGFHGEFPARYPAVHVMLLLMYAGYTLALFALLLSYTGDRALAGAFSLLGALTLPAAAFPFQLYPEVPAGVIIFVLARVLISGLPARTTSAVICGLLAGFLPWLHLRLLAVAALVTIWVLCSQRQATRRRLAFGAGAAIGLGALALYTYRLTGSLLPVAIYGSNAPWFLPRMLRGLPGFALDAAWGLLPHAPLYALAIAGSLPTFRRSPRAFAAVTLMLLAVAIPAAGHGYWAGGATPGRYLVSAAPLLLIFAADAWRTWRHGPFFVGTAIALALVSLETAVRYNLHHRKETGALVAPGFAGWRLNLVFPSLGTDAWTPTSADVVLLTAWVLVIALLLGAGWASARRKVGKGMPPASAAAFGLRHVALPIVLLGGVGTAVGSMSGRATEPKYQLPAAKARDQALAAYAAAPHCMACWYSALGEADPPDALGNTLGRVYLDTLPPSPRAGEPFTLRVRPRSTTGDYVIGSFLVDMGDGSPPLATRAYGDLRIEHVYARPGDFAVRADVRWRTAPPVESTLRVTASR